MFSSKLIFAYYSTYDNHVSRINSFFDVSRLLYRLGNIFRDNEPSETAPGTIRIDRKRRQEMLEKRIVLGHKPDDHEDQAYSGMSMATPW